MLILVAYDVSTETRAGRRRLRRVARVCLDYGQRVQKSVFECRVDKTTYEVLEKRLLDEIDSREDNLRLYRLNEPIEEHVKEFGQFKAVDFDGPLVV
jgi:CRISPR-associated protein Cas2